MRWPVLPSAVSSRARREVRCGTLRLAAARVYVQPPTMCNRLPCSRVARPRRALVCRVNLASLYTADPGSDSEGLHQRQDETSAQAKWARLAKAATHAHTVMRRALLLVQSTR